VVVVSGALSNACACRSESQFPVRMPCVFALFTRAMPTASFRIADILIMIDEDPRPRASSDIRHALTVALVKPGRGAPWNHARNSSSAMLYSRFVTGEDTLSSTSVFSFSHPAIS
jgi:hypothetical protein